MVGKYPNDIDFPQFLFDKKLINRNIIKTVLKDVVNEKYLNKFIKPVRTKLFDGILITDMNDFDYLKDYDSDTEVYVSDKINIISEYRCYVHNRKLVYACNYSGDFTKNIDYNYVQKLIDCYDEQPIAYTIDVACLDDNNCDVIEFNDFYSIGSYGLYCINYAEMLRDRYTEIIK